MWKRSENDMPLSELIDVLERIKTSAPGAANRNPKLGLTKTIEMLNASSAISVKGLISELESKKSSQPSRRKPAPAIRHELINKYTAGLKKAETQSIGAFETLMNQLSSDTKVRVAELKKIVQEYTGDTSTFRRKSDGFGKLRQAFDYRWKLEHRL